MALKSGDLEAYQRIVEDMTAEGVKASAIQNGMRDRMEAAMAQEGGGPTLWEITEELIGKKDSRAGAAAEREIQRLYDAGQKAVVSADGVQGFEVTYQEDGETKRRTLSPKEYEEVVSTKGETAYDVLTSMIRSDRYKTMADEEKASAIALAYAYAAHVAAEEVEEKHVSEAYVALAQRAQKELGLSEAEYLLLYKQYGAAVANSDGIRDAYTVGIMPDEYAGYKADLAELDDNHRKKEDIVRVIDAQEGLSKAEKDALYLEKYAKSGLGETPWH